MTAPFGALEVELVDAPGAWPSGTRVRKVVSEDGDLTAAGTLGTVLGSFGPMPLTPERPDLAGMFAYAVKWDGSPLPPTFVVGHKLAREGT